MAPQPMWHLKFVNSGNPEDVLILPFIPIEETLEHVCFAAGITTGVEGYVPTALTVQWDDRTVEVVVPGGSVEFEEE